jgi:dTDP-4-amino-4,6-dideoxygalactose transaminase
VHLVPFNYPYIPDGTSEAILDSLASRRLSGDGPETITASSLLSKQFNGSHVLLTPSCTHALELAIRLIGVGPGDEVIVPSYTFTSTANAIVLAGATPVFVDIEPETQNIDLNEVRAALTSKTKAVFCINYAGVSAHLPELKTFCSEFGLTFLEDNAHGLGAKSHGQPLGTFSALATQSFHETKNIQCGEGGCLVINDEKFLEPAEVFREKGTNRSKFFRGQVAKYTWVSVGSSLLLADSLAAILKVQLQNFDQIQKMRQTIWNRYASELQDWSINTGVKQMRVPEVCEQPYHMYYLMMETLETRSRFINHLKELGVMATFHYQPLHSSEAGRAYGRAVGDLPNTQRAADCLVRLPLWAGMSESEVTQVINAVSSFDHRSI